MTPDIPHLLAALCPEIYCEPKAHQAVQSILHQALFAEDPLAYTKAAGATQPREFNEVPLEKLENENPFNLPGQRSPMERHVLMLEDMEGPLEPLYFSLLNDLQARDYWIVEKLVDTINATPSSTLSADLYRRLSQGRQEVAKTLEQIHKNARVLVVRGRKWRQFTRRLKVYSQAKSTDSRIKEAALGLLQQWWQKEAATGEHGANLSLPGPADFERWAVDSEAQLRQETNTDRLLLLSELNLLKLQASWVRPFLQSWQAKDLGSNPTLVSAFNSAVFDVWLMVLPASDLEQAVRAGEFPKSVLALRRRRSWPVVLVQLSFRAVPERSIRGAYGYRGRAEMAFTSFALNEDELAVFRREIQRAPWGEVFGAVEHSTAKDLATLVTELEAHLDEPQSPAPQKAAEPEDSNPFLALLSVPELFSRPTAKPTQLGASEPLPADTDLEAAQRSFALLEARRWCRELYDQQKRALSMPIWES